MNPYDFDGKSSIDVIHEVTIAAINSLELKRKQFL